MQDAHPSLARAACARRRLTTLLSIAAMALSALAVTVEGLLVPARRRAVPTCFAAAVGPSRGSANPAPPKACWCRPLSAAASGEGGARPFPTRTKIRRMRVAELRSELSRRGMDASGARTSLVTRLLDAAEGSGAAGKGPRRQKRRGVSFASEAESKDSASASASGPSVSAASVSASRTYLLRFDGGSRGNPGPAGAGMALFDSEDGKEVWSGRRFLGTATNNEAEYAGLVTGLRAARALGVSRIIVEGDSQLIVRQLGGEYRVKSPNLKPLYQEATELLRYFESSEVRHIPRKLNGRADELANSAMDEESVGVQLLESEEVALAKVVPSESARQKV